ncbi:uncharacterized protein LTR77_010684 [Saxophila tyrrhenica]|uniref:CHAT domain-containing protein n=1 Tax=Saxophila tyrrhenica TaxID=1690608 RepID=A0AAV9NUU8_9PEZI|nr:hypothetical protein LTR77_010684 [Saxophila tyrrhenica]
MAEANTFGTLQFSEGVDDWALDGGTEAAKMYYHAFESSRNSPLALSEAQERLKDLLEGQLQALVPVIKLRHRHVALREVTTMIDGITAELQRKSMEHHFAFWQIGFVSSMVGLLVASGNANVGRDPVLQPIHLRLHGVNQLYPRINIRPDEMLADFWKSAAHNDEKSLKAALRKVLNSLQRPLTVLSMSAAPWNKHSVNLWEIHQNIRPRLWAAGFRYIPIWIENCRPAFLEENIAYYRPSIIHLSGNDSSSGLSFQDESGKTQVVDQARLTDILRDAKVSMGLRAVIMNACYSVEAAQAIADAAGFLIGTKFGLDFGNTIGFTSNLYLALARGSSANDAFKEAKGRTS